MIIFFNIIGVAMLVACFLIASAVSHLLGLSSEGSLMIMAGLSWPSPTSLTACDARIR